MDSEKELLDAIRLGKVAEVRRLVNNNVSVRARRVGGIDRLPISLVFIGGDEEISSRVFPEVYFPLHCAVSSCNIEIVQILLDAGAEINFKDEGGDSPLHKAVSTRNIQTVKMLLERGADPNAENLYYDTPVSFASIGNDVRMVEVLVQGGARPDCKNCDGDTPLHRALNNIEMVRTLIRLGTDVNIQNEEGDTVLHLTISYSVKTVGAFSTEMVRALIGLGADVNIQNKEGNIPLHLAIKNRVDMSIIIDLLTARNADINIQNNKGNTASHLIAPTDEYRGIKNTVSFIRAREVGNPCRKESSIGNIVRVFMANGADFSIKNKRGKVPEHNSITEVLEEQKPSRELSNVNSENCQTFLAGLGIE